eukprot:11191886-Lingulodinium_polyedra.AAC.1
MPRATPSTPSSPSLAISKKRAAPRWGQTPHGTFARTAASFQICLESPGTDIDAASPCCAASTFHGETPLLILRPPIP